MAKSDSHSETPGFHYAITVTVREGREDAFEQALVRFAQLSLDYPGTTGVNLIRPTPGSHCREYGVLRSFSSEQQSREFYESDMFRDYWDETSELVEGEPVFRPLHGLEAFFRHGNTPPPQWKMAIVTWLGVYPAVLFWSRLAGPYLTNFPEILATGILVALVVVSLSWFVMPWLTSWLRPWLMRK